MVIVKVLIYKIFTSILKNKLFKYYDTTFEEQQNGFDKGRYCDGYFILKWLIEKVQNWVWKQILHLSILKKVSISKLLNILAKDHI